MTRYNKKRKIRKSSSLIIASKEQVRNFFLKKQLLNYNPLLKKKTGTLEAIGHLGYVQIDTISVIERSHHVVLFTRCPDYRQEYLHDLLAKDKKIFEYWAHAASFVPITDYRFYLRKMQREHIYEGWVDRWKKKYPAIIRDVKRRIKREGGLAASDFEDIRNRKRGPWWDWKPAKAALEIMFWQGELMIKERRNFQRVYDLTERVLPKDINRTMPSIEEEERFFIKRAFNALGVAAIQDINRYIWNKHKLNAQVIKMIEKGEICEVNIEGSKRQYYMLAENLENLDRQKPDAQDCLYFLSPFDNAIILRDRTEDLFDFKYSLECYTPPKKRKYGYFCLPILWKNQLVGRVDLKADREKGMMIVKSLYLEKPELFGTEFFAAFNKYLQQFSEFHKCENIKLIKITPARYRTKIHH